MAKDNKFWFIWNPHGRNPRHPHMSRASADQEAKRLASENPHQLFVVLKAVSAFSAPQPTPKRVSFSEFIEDIEIPF